MRTHARNVGRTTEKVQQTVTYNVRTRYSLHKLTAAAATPSVRSFGTHTYTGKIHRKRKSHSYVSYVVSFVLDDSNVTTLTSVLLRLRALRRHFSDVRLDADTCHVNSDVWLDRNVYVLDRTYVTIFSATFTTT